MSSGLYLNNCRVGELPAFCALQDIYDKIRDVFCIPSDDFYLHQNGLIISRTQDCLTNCADVHVALRLRGGKGGFGSMLRAIGAQIEKTTNREACRDLSGRRLRDINEEKRMKNWLDGQKDREDEAEKRRQQKLVKLQTKPKHVFEDAAYEQARQELTQNVADAVEEGIRKAAEAKAAEEKAAATTTTAATASGSGVKRKATAAVAAVSDKKAPKPKKKKKQSTLWLGGDFSSASDTDSDSDSEVSSTKQAATPAKLEKGAIVSKETAV